jgi:hypothetical protein
MATEYGKSELGFLLQGTLGMLTFRHLPGFPKFASLWLLGEEGSFGNELLSGGMGENRWGGKKRIKAIPPTYTQCTTRDAGACLGRHACCTCLIYFLAALRHFTENLITEHHITTVLDSQRAAGVESIVPRMQWRLLFLIMSTSYHFRAILQSQSNCTDHNGHHGCSKPISISSYLPGSKDPDAQLHQVE